MLSTPRPPEMLSPSPLPWRTSPPPPPSRVTDGFNVKEAATTEVRLMSFENVPMAVTEREVTSAQFVLYPVGTPSSVTRTFNAEQLTETLSLALIETAKAGWSVTLTEAAAGPGASASTG